MSIVKHVLNEYSPILHSNHTFINADLLVWKKIRKGAVNELTNSRTFTHGSWFVPGWRYSSWHLKHCRYQHKIVKRHGLGVERLEQIEGSTPIWFYPFSLSQSHDDIDRLNLFHFIDGFRHRPISKGSYLHDVYHRPGELQYVFVYMLVAVTISIQIAFVKKVGPIVPSGMFRGPWRCRHFLLTSLGGSGGYIRIQLCASSSKGIGAGSGWGRWRKASRGGGPEGCGCSQGRGRLRRRGAPRGGGRGVIIGGEDKLNLVVKTKIWRSKILHVET